MEINPEKIKKEEDKFDILDFEHSENDRGTGECKIKFTDSNGKEKEIIIIRHRKSSHNILDFEYSFIPADLDIAEEDKKRLIAFAAGKLETKRQIKILKEAEKERFGENEEE